MQKTLLNEQWQLLPHIFSTAKPQFEEPYSMQWKKMVHAGLQQRQLLAPRQ